ncbi:MAG TPA: tRNA (adenosine(37)-N6)-threonylcarbamoyltransferase complex ATPase subunit type 1 TsaE [Flavisolibacter sp.]|nr:tRNA (adenosine(37)-N6)-threonylcarbamoyltransferase complex ATPase subunit type 1 TsaE [Flavisolibacter sp.]
MQMNVTIDAVNEFAEYFWKVAGNQKVFAFFGEMGAGKTTLITALCKAKGVTDPIGSPTFSIINQYQYHEGDQAKTIYHIDLYRLKDEEEIIQAGVEDCIYSGAICMVEWPQKAPELFDENTVQVKIEAIDATNRRVNILLPSNTMKEQS